MTPAFIAIIIGVGLGASAAPAAHAAPRLAPADLEDVARQAVEAARAAYPAMPIAGDAAEALAASWRATIERGRQPCPSPHDADDGGAGASTAATASVDDIRQRLRLFLEDPRSAGGAGGAAAVVLQDSTIPPDDTVSTWVMVYEDLDEDGEYDEGEPGIDQIQVSNGMANSPLGFGNELTDPDGTATFQTWLWDSRFITLTVPSGYTATTPFFHRIGADPDSVRFGLRETPETADSSYRWVQISDMQVGNLLEEGLEHGDDLTEIENLPIPPDFIVVTGDLVSAGMHSVQFENYLAGCAGHTIPTHHGYGDHDAISSAILKVYNFERLIGPTCYSFEYGGVHYVMYNDFHAVDVLDEFKQDVWLYGDLFTARARSRPFPLPIVICKHMMPLQGELDLYHQFDNELGRVIGCFSGHWHASRLRDVQRVFDVNTPPSRYAGIDKSSRGFRIVDMSGDEISTELREAGIVEHARIVSPADGDTVLAGQVLVWANVYGSTATEQTVVFWVDGPGGGSPAEPMARQGGWAWSGSWDTSYEPDGSYTLTMQVTPNNGPPYVDSVSVELMRGDLAAPSPFSDWPKYKYDAAGTGRSPVDLRPPLRLLWARSLGSPINVPSPAVAGGRVYIGTSNISTTAEARLYCLDAATGATIWEVPARTDVKSTPAIADGAVYFTNSIGTAFKLDALSGDILWQAQLGDSLERWEMTSPTVFDGRIYVGGCRAMSAIDATTGDIVWQDSGSNTDFIPATYSAAAVTEQAAVFTSKGGMFAYDPVTGDELWSYAGTSAIHRSPAIVDTVVYSADPWLVQRLRGWDLATGNQVYEAPDVLWESTSAPVVGPYPGGGTRIIIAHGGNEEPPAAPVPGRLLSYVPPTTYARWSVPLGEMIASSRSYERNVVSINSTPAWAGDHVYFGADDGILYCIDPENGAVLWSYDLGVPIRSSPAAAGNMLFVNGSDGTLYAFVSTVIDIAGVGNGASGAALLRTELFGNWPNPFNPSTLIRFDLGPAGAALQPVTLRIYSPAGRLVRTLLAGPLAPGHHRITWDGRDDSGRAVASSVYFYELRAGDQAFRRKLVLLK